MVDVNATGVFNTNGLTCPSADCFRCAPPLNTGPFTPNANFSGIDSIRCRYRAEMCDSLRAEEKKCKKVARSLCGAVDTRDKAKAQCKRVLNREWKLKCKEERNRLILHTGDVYKRSGALRDSIRNAKAKRSADGDGNELPMLEMKLSQLKTAVRAAYDEAEANSGGVAFPMMSNSMEMFVNSPASLGTTHDMSQAAEQLNDVFKELKILNSVAGDLCSHEANMNSHEGKVKCKQIEQDSRLSVKRQNACAARLSDYLASTAKIDALIVEKNRRFALLENLETFMSFFTNAWDTAELDGIDVAEPSIKFNLTEHVTSGIVSSMMQHVTVASARRELATAQVEESAFCAQIIPRLQLALLGHGFSQSDLSCPQPHGTFIAGRELPDWSAYFLLCLGIAIGVGATLASNSAPKAVEFVQQNRSILIAILCVVLAGRFF
jgi:hypothetical protein